MDDITSESNVVVLDRAGTSMALLNFDVTNMKHPNVHAG